MNSTKRKAMRRKQKAKNRRIGVYQEFCVAVDIEQIDWIWLYSILNKPSMVYYTLDKNHIEVRTTILDYLKAQVHLDPTETHVNTFIENSDISCTNKTLEDSEIIWGTNYPQITEFAQSSWLKQFLDNHELIGFVGQFDELGNRRPTLYITIPHSVNDTEHGFNIVFDRTHTRNVLDSLSHNMMQPTWKIIRNAPCFIKDHPIGPSDAIMSKYKYFYRDSANCFSKHW